ncbi:UDP-N-acetylenolpyruvoylglucosamine reductase [bacterium]|nr:UDP-N-acetylenolpyruvoylglucosamine reductase [bacterium]
MQNVGAYGQQVSEVITKVEALERSTGKVVSFTNQECDFDYRSSRFKYKDEGKYIITKVTYRLDPAGSPTVGYPQLAEKLGDEDIESGTSGLKKVREATLALRRSKSMVVDPKDPNSRSCGSFFVNPVLGMAQYDALVKRVQAQGIAEPVPNFASGVDVKVPAAWLIEQAGFKKGERRGGVGISENHPLALVNHDGTTQQLLALAQEIIQEVLDQFDVELVREPVLVMPDTS